MAISGTFFLKFIKKLRQGEIKTMENTLKNSPQRRGTVYRMRITTPKKPNSARRQSAKINLSRRKKTVVNVPGKGHNLRRYSRVLIRGRGSRDLPGINYTPIRGAYDFGCVYDKTRRRSIYGLHQPAGKKKRLRRKFRLNEEKASITS